MSDWRPHRVMMPGRVAALLLLVAALLQPAAVTESTVAVLIDHSSTMQPSVIADSRERLARSLGFYDGLTVNATPFDNANTDRSLGPVLDRSVLDMQPGANNSIVIASHGYWPPTTEAMLQRFALAGMPVYWLATESHHDAARVVEIEAPASAAASREITVAVSASIAEGDEYDVVLFGDQAPLGRMQASHDGPTLFPVTVPDSGSLSLSAELIARNGGDAVVARLTDAEVVNVISPPSLLLVSAGSSALGNSLAAGGWRLTKSTPSELPLLADRFGSFDVLILDDVPATALATWSAVIEAVRDKGLGLIVLGGANSFALGAYRDSQLEGLLPLVSEPPDAEKPASVEFLVDISGSMGSSGDTLSVARSAVLEAAAALRPADQVGLLAFDIEARRLLPLAARDDHANAIRTAWPDRASGGTRLGPALQQGLESLADVSAEQKILMVVTDGMLDDDDIAGLEQRLADADVELVAIVVDAGAATDRLTRIEANDRATVLLVDDILRVPALMRDELEARREAVVRERTRVVIRNAVPFLDADDWPDLAAYSVTRPKADATVLLASTNGDALLATSSAGAGRVIAFTGGLGPWAHEWLMWERWPELAGNIAGYAAVRNAAQISPLRNRGMLEFDVGGAPPRLVRLVQPNGTIVEVTPETVAPRRFRLPNPPSRPGTYSLLWESNTDIHRHSFVIRSAEEPAIVGEPIARRFVEDGLLREWTDTSVEAVAPGTSARNILLVIALLVFTATIAAERVPFRIQKR